MKVNVLVVQSCLTICDPMECSHQAPLNSTEFSKQEYWSGLPFPAPEELLHPGIKPWSPASQADSLPFELQRSQWMLWSGPNQKVGSALPGVPGKLEKG